ncbi:phage replication protein [Yersinia enterocolitica]|uniref:replication endonuclease n=1 Tax=Yersinia enterocolitica TaxID=630 RepID=UPI0005DB727F|nr:replication endonuclease [Yersinia enterocolitica]AOF14801.1 replication protein [Yersinia enterocolitica]CFV26822.1 phage replication protein [Yersinia enterocolitica]
MTEHSRSRITPVPPLPYPGSGDVSIEWEHSWNAPRPAIGGYQSLAPVAVVAKPKSHPLVIRYVKRLNALGYTELREPNQTLLKMRRERAELERQAYLRDKQQWADSPQGVEARIDQQPIFIKSHFQNKIRWLRENHGDKHTNAFLTGTGKNALLRLDAVREYQGIRRGRISELMAYFQGVYSHLAELNKRRVKSLANDVAGRINEMFCTEVSTPTDETRTLSDAELLTIYRNIALEVRSLRVKPPHWRELGPKPNQPDEPVDRAVYYSAIARLINADWWECKLWRLRNDWRESQLRAAGLIHKRAAPYISKEALADWMEQKRRNREFFKRHELVDLEGNTVSLEAMVDASISNPTIRRHELMARMKGIELVAQSRGDVGVFYTITCPSKYHANNQSGHANPKWNHSTPPQAQAYLTKLWANIGSKLGRENLRVYGFRVAEPHHDGTPHWHLLLFMKPQERHAITEIMRAYAVKTDRDELGKRTSARFTAKRLDPKKGSATAYIAKYISKNIDGYALDGELDNETGKPMKETARFAMAWASRHRIRQYQPIGTPPVTVWRELRKLSNQMVTTLKISGTYQRGKQLLVDPAMDAVTAAADAGCFATYIMKQGGVLIPREEYTVRIAYQDNEQPNAYGEITEKIFGIYSPLLGEASRICTRLKTWKIVARQKVKPAVAVGFDVFQDGPAVPWSSVNNSPVEQKTREPEEATDRTSEHKIIDFTAITDAERRALFRRIKNEPVATIKTNALTQAEELSRQASAEKAAQRQEKTAQLAPVATKIRDFAESIGLSISKQQAQSLACGATLTIGGQNWRAREDCCLYQCQPTTAQRTFNVMSRVAKLREGVNRESHQH